MFSLARTIAAPVLIAMSSLTWTSQSPECWFQSDIEIANHGAAPIVSLKLSESTNSDWGPELLGEYAVAHDDSLALSPLTSHCHPQFDAIIFWGEGSVSATWVLRFDMSKAAVLYFADGLVVIENSDGTYSYPETETEPLADPLISAGYSDRRSGWAASVSMADAGKA